MDPLSAELVEFDRGRPKFAEGAGESDEASVGSGSSSIRPERVRAIGMEEDWGIDMMVIARFRVKDKINRKG